jgi:hypothetical protein
MKLPWTLLLCSLLLIFGCQSAAWHQGDFTGQGITSSLTVPPTPGMVVTTYEDGSKTVEPLVTTAPKPTPAPAATPRPAVVSVVVVPPDPGMVEVYNVLPEAQKGDDIVHTRVMTWAGTPPGQTLVDVATQKKVAVHNPLPAVTLDRKGIHATAGGGSTETQAGRSWGQQLWDSVWNFFSGWSMVLPIIGVVLLLLFLLPVIFPALAPICAKILAVLGHVLTLGISSVVALMRRLRASKVNPPAPVVAPVAATPVSTGNPVTPTTAAAEPLNVPRRISNAQTPV